MSDEKLMIFCKTVRIMTSYIHVGVGLCMYIRVGVGTYFSHYNNLSSS